MISPMGRAVGGREPRRLEQYASIAGFIPPQREVFDAVIILRERWGEDRLACPFVRAPASRLAFLKATGRKHEASTLLGKSDPSKYEPGLFLLCRISSSIANDEHHGEQCHNLQGPRCRFRDRQNPGLAGCQQDRQIHFSAFLRGDGTFRALPESDPISYTA